MNIMENEKVKELLKKLDIMYFGLIANLYC